MKASVKHILYFAILAVLMVGFASIAILCRAGNLERKCRSVLVSFAEDYRFVTEDDVLSRLSTSYGECVGTPIDSLKLHDIEKAVDSEGAVKKSEAYVTDDGVLHITITQRDPFVRFQNGQEGFYADHSGYIFPLQRNYTSHVMVVDGNVPVSISKGYKGMAESEAEQKWIAGIIGMVDFMRGNIWEKNIVQLHVDNDGQLVLVPMEGKERFIFGRPDEFKAKFDRIEKYYGFIKPAHDEDKYTRVDVRYDGQIICK